MIPGIAYPNLNHERHEEYEELNNANSVTLTPWRDCWYQCQGTACTGLLEPPVRKRWPSRSGRGGRHLCLRAKLSMRIAVKNFSADGSASARAEAPYPFHQRRASPNWFDARAKHVQGRAPSLGRLWRRLFALFWRMWFSRFWVADTSRSDYQGATPVQLQKAGRSSASPLMT